MNNFWSLVDFEYKKILTRKSVLIAICVAFLCILLTNSLMVMGSDPITGMSSYDTMRMDKKYELELSGRPLDAALILEAAKMYRKIPDDVSPYTSSKDYQQYARPYAAVYNLINSAYASRGSAFDLADFQTISKADAEDYYNIRAMQYRVNLENNDLYSQANVETVLALDKEVSKPFTMQYADGYLRFFAFSVTNAFIVMFLIAFILSPIFSEEYQIGTDSLILTSKNGKDSQAFAKLFTAVSFSVAMAFLFLLIGYLQCMMIYGFEGANAQIQLHIPLLTYHFTMIEVAGLLFITTIFGAFLMTGICVCLSSALNKSVVVLAICVIVILLGMFNGLSVPGFEKLRYFLPSSMGTYFDVIVNQFSFHVFGTQVMLYQMVCIVAFVVGSILLLIALRNFKHHQIG